MFAGDEVVVFCLAFFKKGIFSPDDMSRDKGTCSLSCSTWEFMDGSGFVRFPGVEGCSVSGFPLKSRRKSLEANPGCTLLEDPAFFELLSLSDRTIPLWNGRGRKAFGNPD